MRAKNAQHSRRDPGGTRTFVAAHAYEGPVMRTVTTVMKWTALNAFLLGVALTSDGKPPQLFPDTQSDVNTISSPLSQVFR